MSLSLLLGTLVGCMALADVSGGAIVPMGAPEDAGVSVDLRYDPVGLDSSLTDGSGQWEFPIVSGASLRTKYATDLASFALGPEACIGAVKAYSKVLPVLCVGGSVLQLEWVDQGFTPGLGSPYIEPAVGIRVPRDKGPGFLADGPYTLIFSGQLEYMTRFGSPNLSYVGFQVGIGPWIWFHSDEVRDAIDNCMAPCR